MENKLKKLFAFQKFECEPHLDRVIGESESRVASCELSDSELELVSAGGNGDSTDGDNRQYACNVVGKCPNNRFGETATQSQRNTACKSCDQCDYSMGNKVYCGLLD